jgi:multiple sugar transport system permease protein
MEVKKNRLTIFQNPKAKIFIEKLMEKHLWSRAVFRTLFYILVFDLAFVFIFPFLYMIVTSLKSQADLLDLTVKWLPNKLEWQNYVVAFKSLEYNKFFMNSFIVTALAIIGHVLSCSFIAYGFARYKFPGRNILFGIVIFSLIVPVQVIIFPLYMQYSKMGWLNTYLPLTVPTFFGFGIRGGLFVFIFRQFFMGLPYELEEAARIDGCGPLKIFWKIVLPISKSSILVSAVLAMVWHWNEYFESIIYFTKPGMGLLPARLPAMYSMLIAEKVIEEEVIFNEAMVMAATFLVILPILVVYSFLQKKFMEGIERTGLTGQ